MLRGRDVRIFERSPVTAYESGCVTTSARTLGATAIVRATEGYTDSIAGNERELLPICSMMVATEPLPEAVWDTIGLRQRERCAGWAWAWHASLHSLPTAWNGAGTGEPVSVIGAQRTILMRSPARGWPFG